MEEFPTAFTNLSIQSVPSWAKAVQAQAFRVIKAELAGRAQPLFIASAGIATVDARMALFFAVVPQRRACAGTRRAAGVFFASKAVVTSERVAAGAFDVETKSALVGV